MSEVRQRITTVEHQIAQAVATGASHYASLSTRQPFNAPAFQRAGLSTRQPFNTPAFQHDYTGSAIVCSASSAGQS
jgi:hypothetical protein